MLNLAKLPVRKSNVALRVSKGHFATNHSHINYLIDVTFQKSRLSEAQAVAKALVKQYVTSTIVDTIVCLARPASGRGLPGRGADQGRLHVHQCPSDDLRHYPGAQQRIPAPLPGEPPAYAGRKACFNPHGLCHHRPDHQPEHGMCPLLWRQGGGRLGPSTAPQMWRQTAPASMRCFTCGICRTMPATMPRTAPCAGRGLKLTLSSQETATPVCEPSSLSFVRRL